MCAPIGAHLIYLAYKRKFIDLQSIKWTVLLVLYVGSVCALTSRQRDVPSLLFYEYGIFFWYYWGLASSSMGVIIKEAMRTSDTKSLRLAISTSLLAVGVLALRFGIQYYRLPAETINYQPVAYTFIIAVLLTLNFAQSVWGSRQSKLFSILFLVIGTLVAISVAIMQSSLILIFWTLILAVYVRTMSVSSWLAVSLVVISAAGFYTQYGSISDLLWDSISQTRYAPMLMGETEMTSITSRLEIIRTFEAQFSVAPFFGNFDAEIISGSGEGYYLHSIPLSFLTHTGVFGFVLFIIALISVHRSRATQRPRFWRTDAILPFTTVTLIIGFVATFLTWSVFWYTLGLLSAQWVPRDLHVGNHPKASRG